MRRHFKTLADGALIEFDRGQFDDWCVYLTPPGAARMAPRDVDYFAELQTLAQRHGAFRLYEDFVGVYARTQAQASPGVLAWISGVSAAYGDDALAVDRLLTILYAGMVAEENKLNGPLGKRIKRLGVYQSLVEGMPAAEAAQYSRNVDAKRLDKECRARGF
ncbi:DUF7004 family protein [Pseudoxanthomonas indica]|uniref:Uncharacterized protein n=1 Tax=Pseudoxanthomonas indica TaxID=428993 RepID=A0A1T5LZR3_9GAMM|nr:hypothetical protein [Pseudoxanthomonas indica]GGD59730.1 hypothetical protein GCM10007235_34910 [Pseudoxanthomonas indica]SKC81490.1 hypothetical protein SAMN06296058_3522 [Pseudoxanthomonas indica]